jgi:hypothetical protein
MGFGGSRVYTIGTPFDFTGESTIPQEIGQYAIPIPFPGTIQNLEVGGDIFVTATIVADVIFEFQLLRAAAGSNNAGLSFITTNPAQYYVLTGYTSTLTFSAASTAPVELSATNLNVGTFPVNAGDRIALRIIVQQGSPADVAQITRLGFNASVTYLPN